jgi:hypothetical protein
MVWQIVTAVLALAILTGAGAVAWLAAAMTSAGVPKTFEAMWAQVGWPVAAVLLLGAVLTLVYSIFSIYALYWWAVVSLAISSLASGALAVCGGFLAAEVGRSGGDWGALAVMVSVLLGIALPLAISLATLLTLGSLIVLRQRYGKPDA